MVDRWDVERAILNSQVDSRGRLIVLALLAKADNSTAQTTPDHTPAFSTLCAMTGLSRAVVSEWLQALIEGGWVTRVKPSETGGRGNRTLYAMHCGADKVERRSRDLRVPRPKKNSSPSEPFSEPSDRAETVRPANPLAEKQFAQRTPNSSPSEPFRPGNSSPGERASILRTTKNHQGGASAAKVEPGHDAQTPSSSVRSWDKDNRQPRTEGVRVPRQPSLFDIRRAEIEKSPAALKVIGEWLQANGFPNVSVNDCRAVHQAVIRKHPEVKDMAGYLRGIASRGGFLDYYQPIIDARADEINEEISRLQETEPPCEHRTSAGRALHPTTGLPLCPACRRGLPPTVERVEETTHPDVKSALAVYRKALGRHDLTAFLAFAAEATALHRNGVSHAQLVHFAPIAATSGRGLLETVSTTRGTNA